LFGRDLHPIEIIEFACIMVNTTTAQIDGNFQAYVRPTECTQLDPFCIELTGIQQHQVDAAEPLQTVLSQHHQWLEQRGMFESGCTFVPVTWTAWDLKVRHLEATLPMQEKSLAHARKRNA
jgi:inhibitor of KinA sporulation pathway (predicted exonuclease)